MSSFLPSVGANLVVVVGIDTPILTTIIAVNDDGTVDVKAVKIEHFFFGIHVYDNIELARASQDADGNPAAAFWPPPPTAPPILTV